MQTVMCDCQFRKMTCRLPSTRVLSCLHLSLLSNAQLTLSFIHSFIYSFPYTVLLTPVLICNSVCPALPCLVMSSNALPTCPSLYFPVTLYLTLPYHTHQYSTHIRLALPSTASFFSPISCPTHHSPPLSFPILPTIILSTPTLPILTYLSLPYSDLPLLCPTSTCPLPL